MTQSTQTLTPEIIAQLIQLRLPPTPARAKWSINSLALVQAKQQLNIEWPILFRWTTAKTKGGDHWSGQINGQYYHKIKLEQNTHIGWANHTLWHELQHAVQAENFIREGFTLEHFNKVYWDQTRTVGYKANMFEVDCEKVADEMCHIKLLDSRR